MLRTVLLAAFVALCFASVALGQSPLDAALQPLATAPMGAQEAGPAAPQPTTPEQAASEGANGADPSAQQTLDAEGPMLLEDRLAALEELVVELSFKLDQALSIAGRTVPGSGIGDDDPMAPLSADPAAPASVEQFQDIGLPIVSASPSLSDPQCTKQSMFVSSVESALCPPQRPYRLCTGAIGAGNAICFSEPTTPSMISGNTNAAFYY